MRLVGGCVHLIRAAAWGTGHLNGLCIASCNGVGKEKRRHIDSRFHGELENDVQYIRNNPCKSKVL